jgi:hypothetical protein
VLAERTGEGPRESRTREYRGIGRGVKGPRGNAFSGGPRGRPRAAGAPYPSSPPPFRPPWTAEWVRKYSAK